MPSDRILVGVFCAPHCVRGELRLKSYTQDPAAIAGYPLTDAQGRRAFAIVAARPVKDDMLVVRVEGVDDRDAAAALTNTRLFVAREALPPPDAEDEFYHADLVGLRAELADGTPFGTVQAVLNFGADDILEVRPEDGSRAVMLPFTRAVVPVVDVRGGRVVVDPPKVEEDGPDSAESA